AMARPTVAAVSPEAQAGDREVLTAGKASTNVGGGIKSRGGARFPAERGFWGGGGSAAADGGGNIFAAVPGFSSLRLTITATATPVATTTLMATGMRTRLATPTRIITVTETQTCSEDGSFRPGKLPCGSTSVRQQSFHSAAYECHVSGQ